MTSTNRFYIGWDVGGWNCDKNQRSRDAIVILDAGRTIVGTPWRGNLRQTINETDSTREWIRRLFALCRSAEPLGEVEITMGIDTPLGFSEAFVALISGRGAYPGSINDSRSNPYTNRHTERFLFWQGLSPLSPVKDMIGSQATKGMHALAKFAPRIASCGVWHSGSLLTAFEAYPSPCKKSATVAALRADYAPLGNDDKDDALTCALLAYLFADQREMLQEPSSEVLPSEGWIWVPKDALARPEP